MSPAPKPGDILHDSNGDASVVLAPGDSVLDGLVSLVEEGPGWDGPDLRSNPHLLELVPTLTVQTWRSCTESWCGDNGIDPDEWAGYWAPDGDGKRSILVLSIDTDEYTLGERCEQAVKADA